MQLAVRTQHRTELRTQSARGIFQKNMRGISEDRGQGRRGSEGWPDGPQPVISGVDYLSQPCSDADPGSSTALAQRLSASVGGFSAAYFASGL